MGRQIRDAMVADGATPSRRRTQIWPIDSAGPDRWPARLPRRAKNRHRSVWPSGSSAEHATGASHRPLTLLRLLNGLRSPKEVVEVMTASCKHPMIFAVQPDVAHGASLADVLAWPNGRAPLPAPSAPSTDETRYVIGRQQRAGVSAGLGVIVAG